eukprot:TRINITY_DN49365_c0_g1_i1.p1 TRINITY_DN49365_c0_g1~~TRINITY_DN49365_c0_g1_i1.p1  ORF type:complete len:321 (-),score=79.33 TRINITY_DN49365_c0_g1_i1:274-1236(-)
MAAADAAMADLAVKETEKEPEMMLVAADAAPAEGCESVDEGPVSSPGGSASSVSGEAAQNTTSVGSRLHLAGKCKPCAFFHSRGCSNAQDCEFCHECPPQEALRRKRVRRQLLRPLRRLAGVVAPLNKAGHLRQGSDASTVASTADVSGSRSLPSHSRQNSLGFCLEDGIEASSPSAGTADAQWTPSVASSATAGPAASRFQAPQQSQATGSRRKKGRAVNKVQLQQSQCGYTSHMPLSSMNNFCAPTVHYMMVPVSALPLQQQQMLRTQQELQGGATNCGIVLHPQQQCVQPYYGQMLLQQPEVCQTTPVGGATWAASA